MLIVHVHVHVKADQVEAFRAATELDPELVQGWYEIGLLHEERREPALASRSLRWSAPLAWLAAGASPSATASRRTPAPHPPIATGRFAPPMRRNPPTPRSVPRPLTKTAGQANRVIAVVIRSQCSARTPKVAYARTKPYALKSVPTTLIGKGSSRLSQFEMGTVAC